MTNHDGDPYNRSLFVGRKEITELLVDRVLHPATHEHKARSTLIRGAGKSGKSSFLRHLRQTLLVHHQPPIVLHLTSTDFSKPYMSEDALFQSILKTFWPLVEQATAGILTVGGPFLPPLDGFKGYPVSIALTEMASRLSSVTPPQYVVILLDGIEEIPLKLLKQFEQHFISPIFKFPCVRMVATCRKIPNSLSDPSWSTRPVRTQNRRLELTAFDVDVPSAGFPTLAAEQFHQLKNLRMVEQGTVHPITFAELEAQLASYSWNNAGANAYLMRGALDQNGLITADILKDTINYLLARPDGSPFDASYKKWLFKLVEVHNLVPGLDIAKINETLDVNDYERNMFTSELWAAGHGEIDAYRRLMVNREIIILIRELQERR